MGCARALDALAVWLNFFDIKTRHYALMSYATKYFTLNQLFLWKFFCGSLILTFSVIVPCTWLPWSGFLIDGREKPPPVLHITVFSGILSSLSMFVATFNLFRALDSSRFVVRRRIRALSWEMVDWVLYEVSMTSSIAGFVFFWLVQLPTTEARIHLLRIEGVLVQFVLTSIDFYLTTPHFRKNHVFLALLYPSLWLILQFVWIIMNHQPTCSVVDFHRWHAPLVAIFILMLFIGTFFTLQFVAGRLRAAQSSTNTDDIDKSKLMITQVDGEIHVTPSQQSSRSQCGPNSSIANFELMMRSQRATGDLVAEGRESNRSSEGGVYRIGSIGSDASSSDHSHRVIAMGSWEGELPPHVNPDSAHENSCLTSIHGGIHHLR